MGIKTLKRYPDPLVPWHTHLYRAGLAVIGRRKKPWHMHVYRAFQSVLWKFNYQACTGYDDVTFVFPGQTRSAFFLFVDHTVTLDANTGLQRVARMLGRALIANGNEVKFIKWNVEYQTLVFLNETELQELAKWNGPVMPSTTASNRKGRLVPVHPPEGGNWLIVPEVTHITPHAKELTEDVITSARRLGLQSAFIFYDAIPMKRPEYADSIPKHLEYIRQLRRADVTLSISHFSHRDLLQFAGEPEDGAPRPWARPLPLPAESILGPRCRNLAEAMQHNSTILCVGSITPHKNQAALLRAFNRYCQSHPTTSWRLIMIGNVHGLIADSIQQLAKANDRIEISANAPDEKLAAFYQNCAFTVFPSLEEGFGLPIVESLWFGKPCICANFGAMAEVSARGGCVGIDTGSEQELENGIANLIHHPEQTAALCRDIINLQLDTWQDYAASMSAILRQLEKPRP